MRRTVWLAIVMCLVAGPAFALKTYIDYDTEYDATGKSTFAWKETSKTSLAQSEPLLHSKIVSTIEYYLTQVGYREVKADPDLYVTYHTSTQDKVVLNTMNYGYGYPGTWGYWGRGYYGGIGGGTTTVDTYKLGTLIVDVWDAKTNKLVWRGIADGITIKDNPEKMKKKIDKALKQMVQTWQKIKEKKGGD